MSKLTILRGVSGSGKSTWAKQQNAVVVSRDDLRLALFGSDGPDYYEVSRDVLRSREDYISVVEQAAIKAALRAGRDVVSDNTHTMMKYVNRVAKVGWAEGAEVELRVFDVPLDTALARVSQRAATMGRAVPAEAIKRQHDQFQGSKNKSLKTPVAPPAQYFGTPGKPKAFLVDVDGTLAHMNGKRGPFDWKSVGVDDPDLVVMDLVNRLQVDNGYDERLSAIVFSGRDASCRQETMDWFTNWEFMYDYMYMRPANDFRPDNEIKAELFDTHVRDNFDVQFVIDDRAQVVRMWKRMGLKVLNVAGLDDGEF